MKKIIINLITLYQTLLSFDKGILVLFAPGGACKFEVSCSQYAKKMIEESGVLRGSFLALKRIWRCR